LRRAAEALPAIGGHLPAAVIEEARTLVETWRAAWHPAVPFQWSAVVPKPLLQRAAAHWVAVALASREPGTGLAAPPEEARPFFDALVAGITAALAEDEEVRPTLLSVIPAFEERRRQRTVADARKRVLVVDDTEDIRLLLRIGLGHEPDLEICGEAVDGADALDQAERLRPDVILLDLAMPRMSGIEALPRLRELLPGVRIVVFSADLRSEQAAIAAGADGFVVKGCSPRDIASLLREQ
jgi:CheY-like chemotaxis protein